MSAPTAAGFDSHAEDYDAQCMQGLAVSGEGRDYFARGRVAHLRRWWQRTGLAAPRRVIDYGCGLGDAAPLLAAAFPGAEVLGLEPSTRLMEQARQRHPEVRFAAIDGSERGERADLVHLNGVLHHVAPGDRPRVFAALREHLVPGGVLALFENNPLNPGTRWIMSRIPFDRDAVPLTPGESLRRVRSVGLEPVHRASLFWFPRALRLLRPIEPLLAPIPLGAQYAVFARRPE